MHDANGTELKKGDIVLIEAEVTELQPSEDHCNVTVQSVRGRRPDGALETICLNTGVVVKLRNAIVVVAMLFLAAMLMGCKGGMIRAEAIVGPQKRVNARHDAYIKADASLSDLDKRTYLGESELLNAITDEAMKKE